MHQSSGLDQNLSAAEVTIIKDDAADKASAQEELEAETSLESETESTGAESETAEICAADLLHRHQAHSGNNGKNGSAADIMELEAVILQQRQSMDNIRKRKACSSDEPEATRARMCSERN